jgi:multidrug efflux pump subunit AcrB
MKYARDYLKDRFTTVAGVGDISLGGYTEPQLRVWAKANLLKQNNLTVNDLIDAIQTGHIEQPGGFVEKKSEELSRVRTLGEARSVEEFRNLVISKRAGQNIQDSSQTIRLGRWQRSSRVLMRSLGYQDSMA